MPLLREAQQVLRVANEGDWSDAELLALLQVRATLMLAARTSQGMF